MKRFEVEGGGFVEYKELNFEDALIFMGQCGIKSVDLTKAGTGEVSDLELIGKVLKNLDKVVTKVEVDGIDSLNELKKSSHLTSSVLLPIAANVLLNSFGLDDIKKK